MKGYKVFNPDWTCRGFKYEVGQIYTIDTTPVLCKNGFHFCKNLADCFNYYSFNSKNKVAAIEALGEIVHDGNKSCTNKIKILYELNWHEVLDMVNTGYQEWWDALDKNEKKIIKAIPNFDPVKFAKITKIKI